MFKTLIEIWQKLGSDPNGLVEWYSKRRKRIGDETKEEVYKNVLASYNSIPNGADFLFLTRSCYGGIVRFRKSDGYMSTPCGVHTPIPIESFAIRVRDWKTRLKNVSFEHLDYKEAFAQAKNGDLIYCDPPYSHSQGILYGAQDFRLEDLLVEIDKVKSRQSQIKRCPCGFEY